MMRRFGAVIHSKSRKCNADNVVNQQRYVQCPAVATVSFCPTHVSAKISGSCDPVPAAGAPSDQVEYHS